MKFIISSIINEKSEFALFNLHKNVKFTNFGTIY